MQNHIIHLIKRKSYATNSLLISTRLYACRPGLASPWPASPVSPQTLPVKHKLTAAPKVIISTIPDVIRTPEGQRHDNCIRAAHGFYDSYYDLNEYDNTEAVGSYVTGSDGTVYMLNPISYMVSNTYMKLDPYNGDTLVARLPQIVVAESYGNSFVAKMKQDGQDNWTLNADQTCTSCCATTR